ncbi:MAG: glutaredoxin 3 [Rhodospirillaceae bacterium]|nr:glutaredoxin 3 [Rhodospirillaceae bacterium]MEA4836743.1 glutaredoxin 3 [Rhodospirillaceae bacterium]
MAEIEVYSTRICPYCQRAKRLLQAKGAAYREILVDEEPELRDAMIARAGGRRTVPQIFIDGRHIGGFDDLNALDRAGGLDPLLKG